MRRVKAFGLSALLHLLTLGAVSLTWLFGVAPVSEPPVVIRFVSALPPSPRMDQFRSTEAEPAPATEPETPVPVAQRPPAVPSTTSDAPAEPPVPLDPATNLPPSIPDPPVTMRAQAFDPPLPAAIGRPRAASSYGTLSPGTVDARNPGASARGDGDGPGPDVSPADLAAGRPGTPAGGNDGRGKALARLPDVIRPLLATAGDGAARRRAPAAGTRKDANTGGGPDPDDEEADVLGRRYRVHLVDARRLGRSTHDGWRYNEILPLLSEAYRTVAPLGSAIAARGVVDGDIDSVRVDTDAIEIAYHDGTHHVVVPTRDGLVALYVATGHEDHSKVEEAQRALGALRRLISVGVRS